MITIQIHGGGGNPFEELITDDYEIAGEMVYNHVKCHFTNIDPMDYISSGLRDEFRHSLKQAQEKYADKSLSQMLQQMQIDGYLSEKQYQLTSTFFNDYQSKVLQIETPAAAWNYLRSYELSLANSLGNDQTDGQLVFVFCSMMRNYIKYEQEAHRIGEVRDSTGAVVLRDGGDYCILGKKLSCWGDVLGQAVLQGLLAGVTVGLGNVFDGNAETKFWKGLKNGGLLGTAIAFITGISTLYNDNACDCDDTAATPPTCQTPQGFNLIFDNCGDIHTVEVFGAGTAPGFYHWILKGGVAVDYNDQKDFWTAERFVRIKQDNSTIPVSVACAVECGLPPAEVLGPFSYNLIALSKASGPLFVSGAPCVPVLDSENYYVSGPGIKSANNVIAFSCNYAGQITAQGADWFKVKWLIACGSSSTSSCTPIPYTCGSAIVTSTNTCSNAVTTASKAVKIRSY